MSGHASLMVTIHPEDRARVAALAKAEGLSVSKLLRLALDEHLTSLGLPPLIPIGPHGGPRTRKESHS